MYLPETSPCKTVETVTASCLCFDKSCAIFNVETLIMLRMSGCMNDILNVTSY